MGRHKSHRSRFSWLKFFLVVLVIACFAAIGWTGYLLYTHQTNQVAGVIILLVSIGVLIWNILLARRYKVGLGAFFAVLIVTALIGTTVCAFTGIEPLFTMKQKLAALVESFASQAQSKLLPAQKYPAEISGRVVIAEKVIAQYKVAKTPTRIKLTPLEGKIWWVIDITVKNTAYEDVITARYQDWKLEAGDKLYYAKTDLDMIPGSYPMSVSTGQTGQTTFRFLVPDTLRIWEAKLVYQGSEAVSYGSLSGGERVPMYDWDSKSVIREPYEDYVVSGRQMQLRTIASWKGSESTPIRFKASKSPWVVNCGYERVSTIGSKFEIFVVDEVGYEEFAKEGMAVLSAMYAFVGSAWLPDKYGSIVVPKAGSFVVVVDASGVKWWVKVGVE